MFITPPKRGNSLSSQINIPPPPMHGNPPNYIPHLHSGTLTSRLIAPTGGGTFDIPITDEVNGVGNCVVSPTLFVGCKYPIFPSHPSTSDSGCGTTKLQLPLKEQTPPARCAGGGYTLGRVVVTDGNHPSAECVSVSPGIPKIVCHSTPPEGWSVVHPDSVRPLTRKEFIQTEPPQRCCDVWGYPLPDNVLIR